MRHMTEVATVSAFLEAKVISPEEVSRFLEVCLERRGTRLVTCSDGSALYLAAASEARSQAKAVIDPDSRDASRWTMIRPIILLSRPDGRVHSCARTQEAPPSRATAGGASRRAEGLDRRRINCFGHSEFLRKSSDAGAVT